MICRHGIPECLVSDRGPNLLSALMGDVYEIMGIRKQSTTAYHPQTDGLVESLLLAHCVQSTSGGRLKPDWKQIEILARGCTPSRGAWQTIKPL